MTKWEYLRLAVSTSENKDVAIVKKAFANGEIVLSEGPMSTLLDYINELGKEGWEMIGVYTWGNGWVEVYNFKRPLE